MDRVLDGQCFETERQGMVGPVTLGNNAVINAPSFVDNNCVLRSIDYLYKGIVRKRVNEHPTLLTRNLQFLVLPCRTSDDPIAV